MNFTQVFSREQLQELPAKHRLDAITKAVDQFHYSVIATAKSGKTSYLVDINHIPKNKSGLNQFPPDYIVTVEDMIEGFLMKFPECKVEYIETWEETQPGVKKQKKGILIDWS